MSKSIVVLNDNRNLLNAWVQLLGDEAIGFEEPRQVYHYLLELNSEKSGIKYFILDRQCSSGFDVVTDNFVGDIKELGFLGKFLLSSILHLKGEIVEGFDYSLGDIPMDLPSIENLLECNN